MTKGMKEFPRGAEWRRWDLHVHTPASQLGVAFPGVAWDDYVDALENAVTQHDIAVIGVTDYMSIDGYERLVSYQQDLANPRLGSVQLIPNIEFRCQPQTKGGHALNIHLLIDVSEKDHIEKIRKSLRNLQVPYKQQRYGCIKDELIAFAKAQNPAIEDADAYKFGIEQFKPSHTDIFSWLDSDGWLKSHSVIGIANGNDGISGLPLDSFAAIRDELLSRAHFVFSGNPSDRLHYLGLKPDHPPAEIVRQYNSLKPCLHGSDAHSLDKLFLPDKQRFCWIKADPTFLGLLQSIKEPADRTYIGELPEKLREIAENKTYYIDSVEIEKIKACTLNEEWLAGSKVPLNADLVAIIGNKGSGKSALADVIALLGNSKQKTHFSFLKKGRFQGKNGEPAKYFNGKITWLDGSVGGSNLNDDPPEDKVELIRYIPQGHFESLCNELVSGRSNNEFEREIRKVIFSHAGDEIRLGALDFDQLIERQESSYRDQLGEFRKELRRLNQEIAGSEAQLQPDLRRSLQELLSLKQKQIEEHHKIKPEGVVKPSEQLTPEQQQASTGLETIANKLKEIEDRLVVNANRQAALAAKSKAIQAVRERVRMLERQFKQFDDETAKDLATLGLSLAQIATLTINSQALDQVGSDLPQLRQSLIEKATLEVESKQKLLTERAELSAKLNAPQLAYQQRQKTIGLWEEKLRELIGQDDAPESLKGIEAKIAQLNKLPISLKEKIDRRFLLSGEIFDILDAQRKAREELFQPVQDLIKGNSLIRDEYKLQFQATLGGSSDVLASTLFELIKQNSRQFKGEDAFVAVKRLYEQFDMNKREDCFSFVASLYEQVVSAAKGEHDEAVGIVAALRKDKQANEVYDLLFGLPFLEPRYSLLFQDTQIEQLSPGQRGALLLIFYLLVDKGRTPIILDQPEENLDNETIVNLLVPVLSEAKSRRQIIMVTHNPNLAVVCDAEQVIHSSFARKSLSKISYASGSIENPVINVHVVNVLEGTKPAFDNRRIKYH